MNNEFYQKIADALRQVDEKKKLDPVGKADADIDNDGDVDGSDEYLHNRRATIKKKMKHSKSGKLGHKDIDEAADEMEECPECGGSTENHEPDCSKRESSDKKKLDDDLDAKSAGKAMKHDCATHVASESWGYGECVPGQHTLVEQEDGTAIVTHYDVIFEHGLEENVAVEDLTILREKSHLHASKKKMKESVFGDDKRREHEKAADHHADQASHHTTQMNKAKSAGAHPREYDHHKVLAKMHDKAQASHAKAVVYSRRGQHQQAASHSQIANGHSDAVKKKASTYESTVYEDSRAKHYRSATKPETMLDKFKGGNSKKMATDNGIDNPKVELDGEKIEKEKTAGVKKSPPRSGADKLNVGDKKVVKGGTK